MSPVHDMGGRAEFFGPVVRESHEPTFHEPWEGRVFGMSFFLLPLLGRSFDIVRYAMERLPREVYLSSYYRRWLGAFEDLLVEAGYLSADEVDTRRAGAAAPTGGRRSSQARLAVTAAMLRSMLHARKPQVVAGRMLPRVLGTARPPVRLRRFAVGDHVRVRTDRSAPFTRQPGYVSGKPGVVVAHLGATVFPDARAVGRHAWPQHLYTVSFRGDDLWGGQAEPGTEVRVDLYESYLETT